MDGLKHASLLRIYVCRGRHPKPSLELGAQVRDDVSEHVACNNNLEGRRVLYQHHGHGIDIHVLRFDRRVASGYFMKGALPEVAAESQRIALVRHGDFGVLVTHGEGKSGLENSLDPFSGRDAFLYGNLIGRSLLEDAAYSNVQIFGILPKHREVDLGLGRRFERAQPGVEKPHRPYVGVQIQTETDAKKDVNRMFHVRDTRVAKRSEKNRVKFGPKLMKRIGRKRHSVPEVSFRPIIEMHRIHVLSGAGGDCMQNLDGFRRYFRPDSISRDYRNSNHLDQTSDLRLQCSGLQAPSLRSDP